MVMVLLLDHGRVLLASFLDQLLLLFHYPPRSSGALLAGSLPLRYCSSKFASRTPFWVLLFLGHVAGLITVEDQAAQVGEAEVARRGVDFVGAFGFGKKTISTKQKNTSTPRGTLYACSSTRVEEVALFWVSWCFRC